MTQTAIPFLFMRGGSSRGPYLRREDLPKDRDALADVLISMVGSGHPLNIDGIGGGAAVTTKVAMLSPSDDDWADIDYFFAQVSVEDRLVDFKPTCGNILVGVGPAAVEMGLVPATDETVEIRIRAVNTGARVTARVQTCDGAPIYDGDAQIDGVPGTAAPIDLMFYEVTGSATGALFPTGQPKDVIDGIEVTCIDVAMPMVIAKAESFGVTGYESAADLDENTRLFNAMEAVRLKTGALMGMGDVTKSVTPKFGLIAPPRSGGTATVRYFMPWKTHPTLAVTGSQCLGACLLCPGTVGEGVGEDLTTAPAHLRLEHPMGHMNVTIDYKRGNSDFEVISAGLTRTARKLASGEVFIPSSVWTKP
ncbi:MAG: 4-oxalomesaconate tautomerase [Pseudomonadota bacterium]